MIRWWARLPAVAVLATAVASCSAAGEPAVTAVADRFARTLAQHDGNAACAMLTDDARRSTETFGRNCATELATLPDPGAVERVEVWSDAAQVRLDGDTLFLLRFPDGWRVSAAGCTPREEAPYECEVHG